jgi:hypothetical protein
VYETGTSTTLSASQTSTATSFETEMATGVSESTIETSSVGAISVSSTSTSQVMTEVSTQTTPGSIGTGNIFHILCAFQTNNFLYFRNYIRNGN